MVSEHWPRWVMASAAKHFDDRKQSLFMYVEGFDRTTEQESDYIEFRLDGPYINELSQNYYRLDTEINILIVSMVNDQDIYRIHRHCGLVSRIFFDPIMVYKYGAGADDDGSLLGCMQLVQSLDQREFVRVTHFGKIDPAKPILQSSVEGHFHLFLHG